MPIYKGFPAIEPGWVTPWAEQRASGPVWVMSPKDELFFFSQLRAQCCLLLFALGYIDLFSVPQFPFVRWGVKVSPGSQGYCYYNEAAHSPCSVLRAWNTVVNLEGQQGLLEAAVGNVILNFLTFQSRVFFFLHSFSLYFFGVRRQRAEKGPCCVAQAGVMLHVLQSQSPQCWNYTYTTISCHTLCFKGDRKGRGLIPGDVCMFMFRVLN